MDSPIVFRTRLVLTKPFLVKRMFITSRNTTKILRGRLSGADRVLLGWIHVFLVAALHHHVTCWFVSSHHHHCVPFPNFSLVIANTHVGGLRPNHLGEMASRTASLFEAVFLHFAVPVKGKGQKYCYFCGNLCRYTFFISIF